MPAKDIKACMQKCDDRNYGAFVVWRGIAYFRRQSASECRTNLFDFRGATAYINRSYREQLAPCHTLALAMRKRLRACLPESEPRAKRLKTEEPAQTRPKNSSRNVDRRVPAWCQHIRLERPQEPACRAWPFRDLNAFDFPFELGWGPLLEDVLKERGWKVRSDSCHATCSKNGEVTCHTKEFEASLLNQTPTEVFGKRGSTEAGYRLQSVPLPNHALWMMGRSAFHVPGTAGDRVTWRDDFVNLVVEHGAELGKETSPLNYQMLKFPGTETACCKTNISEAFRGKPWYPQTFELPKERRALLKDLRASPHRHWIAKPRNDFGGTGIRVFKASDPELVAMVDESESHPRSVVQSYLAHPLLIGGYKFHCRIHLLVTNLDPLEAYVQENGQCLFATKPYKLSDKNVGDNFDPPVHVTNMGLNATPENKANYFTKKPVVGRGQQIRMKELEAHLAANHPLYDKQRLWSQILQIAADTTRHLSKAPSVIGKGKLVPGRHKELFGMDLMLDKRLNVFMCEVNTDPGLAYSDELVLGSPNPDYHKELKACSQTIHDVFTMLGLDAGVGQSSGSLKNWFKLSFD